MAQEDERQIERILKSLSGKEEKRPDPAACPNEESLADYLRGELNEFQKAEVQAHLVSCAACVDELIAATRYSPEFEVDVPGALIGEVTRLVPEKQPEPSVDLVVRLQEDTIELVRTTGRWQKPEGAVPVAVRGGRAERGGGIHIESDVGGFNVTVYVEYAKERFCDLAVGVLDAAGTPVEGVRVSLFSDGRERVSYLTRGGRVVFNRIAPGEYALPVGDRSMRIGTVRLEIV